MVLSEADKWTIVNCFVEKGWRGAEIVREFPGKGWKRQTVNTLIKKYEQTGSVKRKKGSGNPGVSDEVKEEVLDLIQSQEDTPSTGPLDPRIGLLLLGKKYISRAF